MGAVYNTFVFSPPIRTKELEIEVCKLKCEVISLIQGNIKIPLKGQYHDHKSVVN